MKAMATFAAFVPSALDGKHAVKKSKPFPTRLHRKRKRAQLKQVSVDQHSQTGSCDCPTTYCSQKNSRYWQKWVETTPFDHCPTGHELPIGKPRLARDNSVMYGEILLVRQKQRKFVVNQENFASTEPSNGPTSSRSMMLTKALAIQCFKHPKCMLCQMSVSKNQLEPLYSEEPPARLQAHCSTAVRCAWLDPTQGAK